MDPTNIPEYTRARLRLLSLMGTHLTAGTGTGREREGRLVGTHLTAGTGTGREGGSVGENYLQGKQDQTTREYTPT